jgi:hypothetical protein
MNTKIALLGSFAIVGGGLYYLLSKKRKLALLAQTEPHKNGVSQDHLRHIVHKSKELVS